MSTGSLLNMNKRRPYSAPGTSPHLPTEMNMLYSLLALQRSRSKLFMYNEWIRRKYFDKENIIIGSVQLLNLSPHKQMSRFHLTCEISLEFRVHCLSSPYLCMYVYIQVSIKFVFISILSALVWQQQLFPNTLTQETAL